LGIEKREVWGLDIELQSMALNKICRGIYKQEIFFIIILSFTFILIFFNDSIAQEPLKLKKDRKYRYSNRLFTDSLNIGKPNFERINIELRIWSWESNGTSILIQTQKLKNDKWLAIKWLFYYYNDNHYNFKDTKIDTIELSNNWISIWKKIKNDHLLNIDNQVNVDKKIKPFLKEAIIFADGIDYKIEVLTHKRKRKFNYDNPESYYENYKNQGITSEEYEKFIFLIQLLKKEFKF
jgi:hypothetical protein